MARKASGQPREIFNWLGRIKRAERTREIADERFGYSRAQKMYEGDFRSVVPSFISDVDLIQINEVYAFAKAFVPSIYSRDPFITVTPKSKRAIASAKIRELAVNAYWRELRLKRVMRQIIYDAIFSEGWVKCGYSAALGSIAREEGKPGLEPSEFITNEEIFCTRVSWRNMVKDSDAVDGITDARWVAQQIIKPLEVVQASSLYENTSDIRPAFVVRNDQVDQRVDSEDEKYAVLWEIWDRDTERVYTVSEGSDKYLMNKEWPYEMEGFPYELLRFNVNPDEPYAPNLIAAWEPQLWEKMKIRAMELDHLKRFNRQMFIEEGGMSRSEMDKFTKGKTGSIIQVKPKKQPPQPIPYPPLQPDMYAVEGRIDLDKDNVSGQPNAVRSAPQRTQSRTLGEIDRLISAFQARQSEPQAMVEDFAAEVAYKLLKLMAQYQTAPRYVRATQQDIQSADIQEALMNPETGDSRFDGFGFAFTKKDIREMEVEVSVKAGSTLPLDKQSRVESMISILKLGPTIGVTPGDKVSQVIGKNLISDFEMPEIIAAYEEVLRKMAAREIVGKIAQMGEMDLAQQKAQSIRDQVLRNGGAGGV